MEEFVIMDHGQFETLTCQKRNLNIQIIHTGKIPEKMPDEALIVFGTYKRFADGGVLDTAIEMICCFCILHPEKIEYEPYFRHDLILAAVTYWSLKEINHPFDEIRYSPGYQKTFVDSRSLEPGKMTPELAAYCNRDLSEEALDFYAWREKHLAAYLN